MDAWVWWIIAAAVLAAAEVFTFDLVFAQLSAGALAAAGVAGADGGTPLQIATGIVVALAGLVLLRPVALRHLRTTPELRTGVAALVGQQAEVLEDVGPRGGRVKLAGEVWSARSYDQTSVYGAGEDVAVIEIDGATALVG
ncbi:NfeD family protein [Sporichthya sp.]|uniref:NfeD family protein n=1 Tax=Sporichthya sp. TaxID=65475 RepID=UPI0025ECE2B0|nr:NfeD family protein [Sporichthya sp.]